MQNVSNNIMRISIENYPFKISGSFVITAVGSDGIIMASESRANIFDRTDTKQTPVGYFDTIQKVFPKDNMAIAETGQGVIANTFFSALINDFYCKLVNCSAKDVLPALIEYVNRFLPKEIHQDFFNQKLFSAGYNNSIPTICYYNNQQTPNFDCINHGFIQSDKTIFGNKYSGKMKCQELALLAEEAIKEYASHSDRWKTIGGPISVLQITRTNTEWILNQPVTPKWTYVNEFITAYKSESVLINLIEPHTKGDLDAILGV
jgi:hypothetical protein